MKRFSPLSLALAGLLAAAPALAQNNPPPTDPPTDPQTQTTPNPCCARFVDADGDGYNDNAPDHDGDGIPNGLDPDYAGPMMRRGGCGFIDLNSDGINDLALDDDGDGIPNGRDPDFIGLMMRRGGRGFAGADGDGVNDNAFGWGARRGGRGMRGPGARFGGPGTCGCPFGAPFGPQTNGPQGNGPRGNGGPGNGNGWSN